MRRHYIAVVVATSLCIAVFVIYDLWQWFRHGSIFVHDDGGLHSAMMWLRFPGSFAAALVTFFVYQNVHDYNGYFFRCVEILTNGVFCGLLTWGVWRLARLRLN